ncbi:hypothetical protein D3C81_1429690 [compost metagenome]
MFTAVFVVPENGSFLFQFFQNLNVLHPVVFERNFADDRGCLAFQFDDTNLIVSTLGVTFDLALETVQGRRHFNCINVLALNVLQAQILDISQRIWRDVGCIAGRDPRDTVYQNHWNDRQIEFRWDVFRVVVCWAKVVVFENLFHQRVNLSKHVTWACCFLNQPITEITITQQARLVVTPIRSHQASRFLCRRVTVVVTVFSNCRQR